MLTMLCSHLGEVFQIGHDNAEKSELLFGKMRFCANCDW